MITPYGIEDCLFSTLRGEAATKAERSPVVKVDLRKPIIKKDIY
jgi:hypothetical protein